MVKKGSELYRIREMMAYNVDGGKSLLTEAAGFDKLYKIFIAGMKAVAKTKSAWKISLDKVLKYELKKINQTKIQDEKQCVLPSTNPRPMARQYQRSLLNITGIGSLRDQHFNILLRMVAYCQTMENIQKLIEKCVLD